MNRSSLISLLLVATLTTACRDLRCPQNSTRKGDTCTECEPGWWPKNNVCVKLADDAGIPSEDDAGFESTALADDASVSDAESPEAAVEQTMSTELAA